MAIVNAYNTISAGTGTVTRHLVEFLKQCKDRDVVLLLPESLSLSVGNRVRRIIIPNTYGRPFRLLMHWFVDLFLAPLLGIVWRDRNYVVLANYTVSRFPWKTKTVIVRHPYLLDDTNVNELSRVERGIEVVRRFALWLSVQSSNVVVLQTDWMKRRFVRVFPRHATKATVLNNPMMVEPSYESLEKRTRIKDSEISNIGSQWNELLFLSRYYPHKNHDLLTTIAEEYAGWMNAKRVRFGVTVRVSDLANTRLGRYLERTNGRAAIRNYGEVTHHEVPKLLDSASALFFPSKSETFGNPLVEAMARGCPVLVADLPYARVLLDDAAWYFDPDSPAAAVSAIDKLLENHEERINRIRKAYAYATQIPTVEDWYRAVTGSSW